MIVKKPAAQTTKINSSSKVEPTTPTPNDSLKSYEESHKESHQKSHEESYKLTPEKTPASSSTDESTNILDSDSTAAAEIKTEATQAVKSKNDSEAAVHEPEQASLLPESAASMANTLAESEHLFSALEEYLPANQITDIAHALEFGATAHSGQTRASGEAYIAHPISVAIILADMRLDAASIVAAILHDVIEDTEISKGEIAEQFGQDVAELVEGVTKLDKKRFDSKQEAQAASFQKMLLAMTQDIRVILVKLADRLHNIRTISALKPKSRWRIAHETLEIYAPIAQRLGMNSIRHELQDLGFKAYRPKRYEVLEREITKSRDKRKEHIKRMEKKFSQALKKQNISAEITGREKHPYSAYKKMLTQLREAPSADRHGLFRSLNDIFGFRIVVESVDECYRVLGIVHSLYNPTPGRFKDYIAIPKANGYQSLHTAIKGPTGLPMEVQIRTRSMHQVAEHGIAAHWRYKMGGDSKIDASTHMVRAIAAEAPKATPKADKQPIAGDFLPKTRTQEWVSRLLDMQQDTGDSVEFLESVKTDLFPDELYVFTPKGDIKRLPRGATVIDYAYSLHTEIGNRCVGAIVDDERVLLRAELLNGQTVRIQTDENSRPDPQWLNFVVTAKARTKIRDFLKNMSDVEAQRLGLHLLNRALAKHSLQYEQLSKPQTEAITNVFQIDSMDELTASIGSGERTAALVAERISTLCAQLNEENASIKPEKSQTQSRSLLKRLGLRRGDTAKPEPLLIRGTEGLSTNLGNCCHPIPDDDVVGYLTHGKGMVIHRTHCHNLKSYSKDSERWIDVEWAKEIKKDFPALIHVQVTDRRGALADISSTISDLDANIAHIEITAHDAENAILKFVLGVKNRKHLADIMRRLHARRDVIKATRPRG